MGWLLYPTLVIGLVLALWGGWRMVVDGRRILYGVMLLGGAALALLSVGVLLAEQGNTLPLAAMLVAAGAVMTISYPVLTIFLLLNGITMLQRESRTLGNALSLLAGLAMIGVGVLPSIQWPESWGPHAQVVLNSLSLLIVVLFGYAAVCFVAFAATAWLYRRLPLLQRPEAVIVLGAGLIGGDRVSPLLASWLAKAQEVQRSFDPAPLLITSGGQGADETLPEGEAMRTHVIATGTPSELVVPETRSRTTRENLTLSRALLPRPDAPVVVVTSNYHAFRAAMLTRSLGMDARVVGSPTAGYYYPSAVIREFAAVMRDNARLNLIVVGMILVCYVLLLGLTLSLL